MFRPQEYERSTLLSRSDLLLFRENLAEFHRLKILGEEQLEEEIKRNTQRAFDVGDITECMLLQPHMKKEFYVQASVSIGEKLKIVVDNVYKQFLSEWEPVFSLPETNPGREEELEHIKSAYSDLNELDEAIIGAAKAAEYYYNPTKEKPWSRTTETILADVKTNGKVYYDALIAAAGKHIVRSDDWELASACADKINNSTSLSLKEFKDACEYIRSESHKGNISSVYERDTESHGKIIYYVGHVFASGGKKILVDLAIYYVNAKLFQIYDLKTIRNLNSFPSVYRSDYAYQGAFYNSVVKEYFGDDMFNVVLPFKFVAISKDENEGAEVFIQSSCDHEAYLTGYETKSGYKYSGINEMMDDIQWHIDNNVWNRRRHFVESDTEGGLILEVADTNKSSKSSFSHVDIF